MKPSALTHTRARKRGKSALISQPGGGWTHSQTFLMLPEADPGSLSHSVSVLLLTQTLAASVCVCVCVSELLGPSKLSLSPAEVKDMWSLSERVLSLSRELSLKGFQLRIRAHILGTDPFWETISCCSQPAQTAELFISCLQPATGV